MATTFFKPLTEKDRTSSRTLLHEAIPITGTLIAKTAIAGYTTNASGRELNIKTFSHGMFQSVYDYPYLSSSANHIFDLTAGISAQSSSFYLAGTTTQKTKKANVYSQMSQILNGYNTSNVVRAFDSDGDFSSESKIEEAIFLNLSRLLTKDEIKKGSFELKLGTAAYSNPNATVVTIKDHGGETSYKTNSPAGEYGLLHSASAAGQPCGLIFYQTGVIVLTGSVFGQATQIGAAAHNSASHMFRDASIDQIADGVRKRIQNISLNNTTELNSTIYFCRANHHEFNYSSNPTYLASSKIRVKGNDILQPPRSYVTTVGLYSADNELLAVAKLSEPLRKDPTNELTLRVRLDY